MDKLNVGTKEVLVLQLADRLDTVTDLAAYNAEQQIVTEDEQTVKQAWTTVFATNGMGVHCLIDTTSGGGWAEGIYKLYIRVNIPPELPVLGPFEFELS